MGRRALACLSLLAVALLLAACRTTLSTPSATAIGSTATVTGEPTTNPVVVENQQPGSDAWELNRPGFRIADDVNKQIKGYAAATSVDKGGAIDLKVSVSPAQAYTIDVYRMGWYGGAGGRLLRHVGPLAGTSQPACAADPTYGTVSCAWATSYTLDGMGGWTSGVYLALLTNAANYQNYIVFVVRDDARPADLLYQQPVTTYQAYNNYPNDGATGKSLYAFNSHGAIPAASNDKNAVKVSYDRPYANFGAGDFTDSDAWYEGQRWEPYLLRWLEREGYDVAYATSIDLQGRGAGLLANHRAFLSAGHDEYWSKEMYDAAEAARDAGKHLAFFGGNSVYLECTPITRP